MNLNRKQLQFASILVILTSILTLIISHEYQFCTGTCTGNLSNCWCAIVTIWPSVGVLIAALLGSAYYYLKANPPFFTFLAVVVALLIIAFIATLLAVVLIVNLLVSH